MHRTGVKGFNGPPRATPHGPTVFAHGFRMASKASSLVEAGLTGADLTGCRIYGVSAQCLKLEGAKQQYLVVTSYGEPEITVDNIEVAQFVYLLLHNEKIRDVIDTIGKKGVLLLGPPCHPVARIQRHALRHHVRVVTGRSGC